MTDFTFKECASCAAKPGMAALCESCLHNRHAIFNLEGDVGAADGAMEIVAKQIKRAGFKNPRKHTNARGEVREVYVQTHNMVELVVTELLQWRKTIG